VGLPLEAAVSFSLLILFRVWLLLPAIITIVIEADFNTLENLP